MGAIVDGRSRPVKGAGGDRGGCAGPTPAPRFTIYDKHRTINPELLNPVVLLVFQIVLRFQLERLPDVRAGERLDV
jgi:hypothetical protein